MQNRLTYITLTFNAASTIQKTINSLKNVKKNDIECIVIDGGSTDETLTLLRESGVFDEVITEQDNGLAHALNKGLLRSTGEVISVLMSGTELLPGSTEIARKHYDDKSNEFSVLAGSAVFDENFSLPRIRSKIPPLSSKNTEILHETIYIPRKVYELVGLYDTDFKISSDFDWISRASLKSIQMSYSDELFVDYGSGWGKTGLPKNFNIKIWEHFRVMRRDVGFWFAINRLSKRYIYNRIKKFL